MRKRVALVTTSLVLATVWLAMPAPARAWMLSTQLAIAEQASHFAPPDLQRQMDRHRFRFVEGVREAARSPRTGQALSSVLEDEVDRAVEAIRSHRPFADVVRQLGIVAYYTALANQPLYAASTDPDEGRYSRDYPKYVESARGRFAVAFYGEGRRVDSPADVNALVRTTFARGRTYYDSIGREYRRIEYLSGVGRFDDRSTAFGISALAFSHAVSDTIAMLRYVWVRSGGADNRDFLNLTPPR